MAAADEEDAGARAVVPLVLPRGAMGVFEWLRCRWVLLLLLCFFNKCHAGAQDFQTVGRHGDHRGFEADFAGAAIEEKRRVLAEGFANMLRRGGRKLCEAVGAGCSDGESCLAEKRERHGMPGHAQPDGGETRGGVIGNYGFLRNHECERAGPVFAGEALGFWRPNGGELARLLDASHMHDERAGGGAALERIDSVNRRGIERVGTEAVDGFRWEND